MTMARRIKVKEIAPPKPFNYPVQDITLYIEQTIPVKMFIKRPNVDIQNGLTKAHVKELKRCKKDPVYFLENYVYINNLDKGMVPFRLYDYQKKLIRLYQKNRFVLALQARQSGKSTITAGFMLWYALFHKKKTIACLANKQSAAAEVLDRVKEMYESVPYFMQQGCLTISALTLKFENGSKIFCAATSPSAIRGKSCNLLYVDETAFVPNEDEFFTAVNPTITAGKSTKMIISSTPNGARGFFYRTYTDIQNGNSSFVCQDVKWFDVPGRDEKWKKEALDGVGNDMNKFRQEYENSFVASTGALISSDVLAGMRPDPALVTLENLKIYKPYDLKRRYIATLDPAMGLGGDNDYSQLTIFDVTQVPYKISAVWRSNEISSTDLPMYVVQACDIFGECPLLVETNNEVGGQVSYSIAYELEYANVIWTGPDRLTNGVRISSAKATRPGVSMSTRVKAVGCSTLKTMIETGSLVVCDPSIIDEMGTFVRNGSTFEAIKGSHDDAVMTCVSFCWLIKQDWFKEYSETDINKIRESDFMLQEFKNMVAVYSAPSDKTQTDKYYTKEDGMPSGAWIKDETFKTPWQ